MSDLLKELETLQAEAIQALAQADSSEASEAWYREYLSRQGKMTAVLRGLGQLSKEERPAVGQAANAVKVALETALQERQATIKQIEIERALSAEGIDVTLPGRPQAVGKLHPTTTTMREIVEIFGQMGFQVYDAREVETDETNFGLLNFLPGHPARDMQDTFFTTTPDVILRTHTS
ncbi:MAG: phenylalanine--tRNA ligase subunit alpha, partial [Chloroflexi bacterium]|nr:phenylalanine--tRNA ligase subunit alpha [Chloroflexota bacterium]